MHIYVWVNRTYCNSQDPCRQRTHVINDDHEKENTGCCDELKHAEAELEDSQPLDPPFCPVAQQLVLSPRLWNHV